MCYVKLTLARCRQVTTPPSLTSQSASSWKKFHVSVDPIVSVSFDYNIKDEVASSSYLCSSIMKYSSSSTSVPSSSSTAYTSSSSLQPRLSRPDQSTGVVMSFQLRSCSSISPTVCVSVRLSVVKLKFYLVKAFYVIVYSSRMFQNISECSRMFQNVSECFRMLQNVAECFRMFQNVSECF